MSRRRPGFTLIEMLAVLFAMTVALGAGGLLVQGALTAHRSSAATADRLGRRAELADRFRADVAAATAADVPADLVGGPTAVILTAPGGRTVAYRASPGRVDRVERGATTPFALAAGAAAEFDTATGDRPVVTLRLAEPGGRGPARRTNVSAALGGDLR